MMLKIGNRAYSISFQETSDIFSENPDAFSYVSYPESKIVIQSATSPDFMKENLLHEILHALFENSGVAEEFGTEIEKFIKVLTPRLHNFLKENKEIVNFLGAT